MMVLPADVDPLRAGRHAQPNPSDRPRRCGCLVTTIVPRSMTPRFGPPEIATMRAPTSAIVPSGVSLACSKPIGTPAASGSSGFSTPCSANANVFASSRV